MNSMTLSAVTADGHPRMPRRPGYGTVGRPAWVRANFFPVKLPEDAIFMYDVNIEPDAKNKRKRKRLYEILEKHEGFKAFMKHTATDYGKIIVSTKPLNPKAAATSAGEKDDRVEVSIVYTDTDDQPKPEVENPKHKHTFIITRTALIQPSDFQDYVAGRNPNYSPSQAIQAMNIILAKFPSKSPTMVPVGRNKFFVKGDNQLQVDIGAGLLAVKGFYTSIRPSVGGVLCNLNVCTTAFYASEHLAINILKFCGMNRLTQPLHESQIKKLKTHLRHVRIEYTYLKDKKTGKPIVRQRSITGVSFLCPKDLTFEEEDVKTGKKSKTSVQAFFRARHGINLEHPFMPCINIGSANPVWIPAEVARIVEGQAYFGKLPDRQTAEMIKIACRPPKENAEMITNVGLPRLGLKGLNSHLDPFKMSVSQEMIVVPARILPPPPVTYAVGSMTPTGASWNLMKKRFQRGASMAAWSYLIIQEPNRPINVARVQETVLLFQKTCSDYGMNVKPPMMKFKDGSSPLIVTLPQRGVSHADLEASMKPAFRKLREEGAKIVYVFLPSLDKVVYSAVKYFGDTKAGISTVCSQWDKIINSKGIGQYLANVALKFNIKMGGTNHIIGAAQLGEFAGGKTMIVSILFPPFLVWLLMVIQVGCDVTHPSPGSLKGTPSIAGVVASIDPNFSQYPASLRMQESKKEMITAMDEMMKERLRLWSTKNGGRWPEKIIVYRDGVSEGQFHQVLEQELPLIQKACVEITPGNKCNPKITVIIVGKRHHTRFYPTDSSSADSKNGNPQPGTCVDRGVTAVYDFDFYLQAHAGIKGTARPAHYYVIHDQNKFGANALQTVVCFNLRD